MEAVATDTGRRTGSPKAGRRQAVAWTLVFFVAACWPVLWFAYPAGQDAPNHLARAFILLHPDDPLLARHFAIAWHTVPDLVWDGFALAVGRLVDLVVVLKLFMLLGLGLGLFGMALINRQIAGRWTYMPLLGTPFLFNTGYAKGFLGFNVAFGLGLVAIALWRFGSERNWKRRLALGWLASTLLFFAHLVPWGIYGVTLFGLKLMELPEAWRTGGRKGLGEWTLRLLRDGTQALPPLILFGAATLFGGQSIPVIGVLGTTDPPWPRLIDARRLIDAGWYLPSLPVLGTVALLLFFLLFWRRTLRFDRSYALPIGLLVLLFFLIPNEIYATYYIAWRLALGAACLAIASGVPTAPITGPVARTALAIILASVLVLSGWQAASIANADAERAGFAALIARIPAGDTLFAIHSGLEMSDIEYDRIGLMHFGADAVRQRRIVVQSLFANPAQQPIRYREAALDRPRDNTTVLVEPLHVGLTARGQSLADYVAAFDWVAVHGPTPGTDRSALPLDGFALAGERGRFRLYCHMVADPSGGAGTTACPDGAAP